MATTKQRDSGRLKEWLILLFNRAEDIIYIGLGVLLAVIALVLLGTELIYFAGYLAAGTLGENIVFLLDRILLIIIFVEVLYTVQVSFRQHVLRPEPFLVVGMIAVTRRILVLTAEMSKLAKETQTGFYNAMIELGLLTVLIIA
ncbi:MAG: phosphate-starvation-inducible PsiE family protein, partial [Candidatus Binatia bacterium]